GQAERRGRLAGSALQVHDGDRAHGGPPLPHPTDQALSALSSDRGTSDLESVGAIDPPNRGVSEPRYGRASGAGRLGPRGGQCRGTKTPRAPGTPECWGSGLWG